MKNKSIYVVATLLTAFLLTAGGNPIYAKDVKEHKTVRPGVFIEDIEVSNMEYDQVKAAVESKIEELKNSNMHLKVGSEFVSATAGELGLIWKNEEVVEDAINLGNVGNVVSRYKVIKDLEREPKVLDLAFDVDEQQANQVVQEKCVPLNREAKNASLERKDGEFIILDGLESLEVNVEDSTNLIRNFVTNEWQGGDSTIEVSVVSMQPKVTNEELTKVKDVLGKGSTDYSASSSQRAKNVRTGTEKLNGTIIYPGETFSVTDAVVPFDADNGYEKAPSYENGSVVDTYGGGICQVSTTLYLAVLRAELEVVERHNHSMIVGYVKPSMDAAIAEGIKDLRFKNNTQAPIYIEGYTYGGEVGFKIYGQEQRSEERSVTYESETTSTTEPEVKLVASSSPVGTINKKQNPHTGYTAQLWKIVTENGETKKERVNKSSYAMSPTIYEIGVGTDNETAKGIIQSAIASNSLDRVHEAISQIEALSTPAPTPETPAETTTQEPTPEAQTNTEAEASQTPAQ